MIPFFMPHGAEPFRREPALTGLLLSACLLCSGCDNVGRVLGPALLAVSLVFLVLLGAGLLFEVFVLAGTLMCVWKRQSPLTQWGIFGAALLACAVHGSFAVDSFRQMQAGAGSVDLFTRVICLAFLLPAVTAVLGGTDALLRLFFPSASRVVAAVAAVLVGVLLYGSIHDALALWTERQIVAIGAPTRLVIGHEHSCVLTTTGAVMCWGTNRQGQLGIGPSPKRQRFPSAVPGLEGATALVGGDDHTCALRAGQVLCWGDNSAGALGPELPHEVIRPTALPGIDDATALYARGHALWIYTASGKLRGFGKLDQRGILIAEAQGPKELVELVAGDRFFCGRLRSGRVYCSAEIESARSQAEVEGPPFIALAATDDTVYAVGQDGSLASFSPVDAVFKRLRDADDRAQRCELEKRLAAARTQALRGRFRAGVPMGVPPSCETTAPKNADSPKLPSDRIEAGDVVSIALGDKHRCISTRGGQVVCSGDGFYGQLGNGLLDRQPEKRPAILPGNAVQVFARGSESCARLDDGRFFCWGRLPLGVSEKNAVNCQDTWLGKMYCVPKPAELELLRTMKK